MSYVSKWYKDTTLKIIDDLRRKNNEIKAPQEIKKKYSDYLADTRKKVVEIFNTLPEDVPIKQTKIADIAGELMDQQAILSKMKKGE